VSHLDALKDTEFSLRDNEMQTLNPKKLKKVGNGHLHVNGYGVFLQSETLNGFPLHRDVSDRRNDNVC
jgi:hypothetical protein